MHDDELALGARPFEPTVAVVPPSEQVRAWLPASAVPAALTILLSSFLLFLVQPIIAKQILPWFGGAAGTWNVCLVFFQLVLFLAYAYAHWLTQRLAGRRQFLLHIALLLTSCLLLPITPSRYWQQAHNVAPELQVLGVLTVTVGLPYFLLASNGPLLQRWLSAAQGRGPTPAIYRLFALSNLGSLLGLLSYPFAIEPLAPLRTQAAVWSLAFVVFVVSSVICAWRCWRNRESTVAVVPPAAERCASASAPAGLDYARWAGCAALGSILLVAATSQITQNVAAIPLLWIVPLGMYLLSFAVCFEGRGGLGWYERRFWLTPAMIATGAMAWALSADSGNLSVYVALPLFACGVFLGCMVCHGELARSKPSPRYLTHFYLCLAGGGAAGGLLTALIAPQVFAGYWEMPLVLVALAALGTACSSRAESQEVRKSWTINLMLASLVAGVVLVLLGVLPPSGPTEWAKIVQGDARWGCGALLLMTAALLQAYGYGRAVALTAVLCSVAFGWCYYANLVGKTDFGVRNFYGTLLVTKPSPERVRLLMHGVIVHGSQSLTHPEIPTTYYGRTSGIGRAIEAMRRSGTPLRIGSVGLGAGTLAAYGTRDDLLRVYELNPAVIDIARRHFTYLRDTKARTELVLGDARLSLEREIAAGAFDDRAQRFDVLSLDAFSGDAIPVHLLTLEAFEDYTRVMKPDGVVAFHLSNRYLNLPPIVAAFARAKGYQAVLVQDRPQGQGLDVPSDWVLVSRNTAFLSQPEIASHGVPLEPLAGLPMWTDQFTSLLQVLKPPH